MPYAGIILTDFGADVVRVDPPKRSGLALIGGFPLNRGKRSIAIDLKSKEGVALFRHLATTWADVVLDPFRPGVLEKLGLGPDSLIEANPRLVVARLTGYGQQKAMARDWAGHDINYMSLSGALGLVGRAGSPPYAPLNLVADFAGGGMLCAMGVVMALLERERSGKGQVCGRVGV